MGAMETVQTTIKDRLARNVRVRRAELGWSQTRLASEAGLGRALVNEIEQGKANPTLETLKTLADTLGAGTRDLLA